MVAHVDENKTRSNQEPKSNQAIRSETNKPHKDAFEPEEEWAIHLQLRHCIYIYIYTL